MPNKALDFRNGEVNTVKLDHTSLDNILSFTVSIWMYNHSHGAGGNDCILTGANSGSTNELTICEDHANIEGSR